MNHKFKAIVIVNGDKSRKKSIRFEAGSWGIAVLRAHKIVGDYRQRMDFQDDYEIIAIVKEV